MCFSVSFHNFGGVRLVSMWVYTMYRMGKGIRLLAIANIDITWYQNSGNLSTMARLKFSGPLLLEGNITSNWKTWKREWSLFSTSTELTAKSEAKDYIYNKTCYFGVFV